MSDANPETLVCSCGGTLFWESSRVSGWWKVLINGDGEVMDTDLTMLKHGPHPRSVVCAECQKKLLNPLRYA